MISLVIQVNLVVYISIFFLKESVQLKKQQITFQDIYFFTPFESLKTLTIQTRHAVQITAAFLLYTLTA